MVFTRLVLVVLVAFIVSLPVGMPSQAYAVSSEARELRHRRERTEASSPIRWARPFRFRRIPDGHPRSQGRFGCPSR